MKEIKILKTSIGAVFNIKYTIAEITVGLPAIILQNKINQIKHYLKIIMNDIPEDPLKECIKQITEHNPPPG